MPRLLLITRRSWLRVIVASAKSGATDTLAAAVKIAVSLISVLTVGMLVGGMEEEEARRNYCRRMISVVRRKQPKCGSSVLGRRERENQTTSVRTSAECRMRTAEGESSKVAVVSGIRRTPFRTESRPEAQPVPAQLVTMLRLKTAREKISRVIIIIVVTN